MKKFIIMFFASIFILSSLSGCSSSQSSKTETSQTQGSQVSQSTTDTSAVSAEKKKIVSDTPVELSLGTQEMPFAGISYADNLPVFQELEKRTGVKIKWDIVDSDDYVTVMKTRIAAATDLPDIFSLGSENVNIDVMQLIKSNLILPLDDLINNYGPDIKTMFEDNPDVKAVMVAPDGKTYCLPNRLRHRRANNINPVTFIIRNDWLQKLEVGSNPETIDEWYNVLTLFKTKDPNKNGKNDEIPFSGTQYEIKSFGEAYGIHFATPFFNDKDGVIQYDWMLPSAKEYLQTMNKWYKEKLIDPQYLTITTDALWGQMLDDLVGSTYVSAASNCSWLNINNKVDKNADWLPVIPPENVNGADGFTMMPYRSGGKEVISASCKNPDIAIKWLNYLYSREGSLLTSVGIEGVHYTVSDGKIVFINTTENWLEDIRKDGVDPDGVPQALAYEYYDRSLMGYGQRINDAMVPITKYFVNKFPNYISTDEENKILNAKLSDINTYTDEMLNKFIIGSEPISNFDKFVEKLRQMGIEEVKKVYQAQYDRNSTK